MGTRLYPGEDCDVRTMEILAGVPEGTSARLKTFKKELEGCLPNSREEEAWYDKLFLDAPLHTLENFEVYGWGKLGAAEYAYIDELNKDCDCGGMEGAEAQKMLELHGVTLPEGITLNTVSWS